MKLLLTLFFLLELAAGMNITCSAFGGLPQLTYDNVTPQALQAVIVVFKPHTSRQTLDAYADALRCRGSQVDTPNYNIEMITGHLAGGFIESLKQHSPDVVSVELDGLVTALPMHSPSSAAATTTTTTAAALSTTTSSSSTSSAESSMTTTTTGGASTTTAATHLQYSVALLLLTLIL